MCIHQTTGCKIHEAKTHKTEKKKRIFDSSRRLQHLSLEIISKDIKELNTAMNQQEVINIYRLICQTTAK